MRNSATRRPGRLLKAVLAVLLIAGSLAFNKTSAKSVQDLGLITGFEALDLQGRLWTCQEMKGKVVLIEFWATWCTHCLAETENLKEAYQRYHDQGFEIIGVCLDLADRREVEQFLRRYQIPWPQVFDGQGFSSKLVQRFGVRTLPAHFLSA